MGQPHVMKGIHHQFARNKISNFKNREKFTIDCF